MGEKRQRGQLIYVSLKFRFVIGHEQHQQQQQKKVPKMRQICAQSLFSSSHSTCLARPVQGTSLECVCKCVCVTTTTTRATKSDINNGVALEPSQGDRAVKVCDACDINQQRQCEFVNGREREAKRRGRAGATKIDRLVESPQCLA